MWGLGLGCLEQFAGETLDFDAPIRVGDRARVSGRGGDDVELVLDRAALLDEVDSLDRLDHPLAKTVGKEGVEVIVDLLLTGVLDRLDYRLGAAVRVLAEDRNDLIEPAVGSTLGVADADLRILVSTPHDPIAADVIEQEEPGAEGLIPDLRVPHEEAAGQAAPSHFDAAILVRQKHEHVAIAREQRRILAVDGDALAEFTRHTPVTIDTVPEPINEHVDRIGVPDPTVVGSGRGAKLAPELPILGAQDDIRRNPCGAEPRAGAQLYQRSGAPTWRAGLTGREPVLQPSIVNSPSPAYELWHARGTRPLVRLSDAASDGDLLIRTQTIADILGTRIILYRVPFVRPGAALAGRSAGIFALRGADAGTFRPLDVVSPGGK
jgi:hypothetical protein